MADSSLAPVIVGGLLALGGVALTGGVSVGVRFLQSREEKRKRRAEKFEELVAALYEFDHWLDKLRFSACPCQTRLLSNNGRSRRKLPAE